MNKETIRVSTKVIIHAGNARTQINDALKAAESFDFDKAHELLDMAVNEINLAHQTQTETIQAEARGDSIDHSLLFTHAQDTLMSSITELNLAQHLLSMYERFCEKLQKLEKQEK